VADCLRQTPRLSAPRFSKYSSPDRRAMSVADYFPATSFWNLGFLRSGSKLGSISGQPGDHRSLITIHRFSVSALFQERRPVNEEVERRRPYVGGQAVDEKALPV